MRKRSWTLLTVSVLCGLLASYLALGQMRAQAAGGPRSAAKSVKMVVAARDLPVGTVLGADDVKLVDWYSEELPTGFLTAPEAVVGQGVLMPLRANEPVLRNKVASSGGVAGISVLIPRGMRAVSVKVDDAISVAGFAVPGTRVDVLATMPGNAVSTQMILQNVQVLANDQSYFRDSDGKAETSSVITLLVTPSQSERLTLAATEGRIHLAMRNASDRLVARTYGARLGRAGGAPSAADQITPPSIVRVARRTAATARRSAVEIFHGSNRTVAVF